MSTNFRISHAERNFGAALRQHIADQETAREAADKYKALFADVTRECSPAHIQV
jgi:hypothetical protein